MSKLVVGVRVKHSSLGAVGTIVREVPMPSRLLKYRPRLADRWFCVRWDDLSPFRGGSFMATRTMPMPHNIDMAAKHGNTLDMPESALELLPVVDQLGALA